VPGAASELRPSPSTENHAHPLGGHWPASEDQWLPSPEFFVPTVLLWQLRRSETRDELYPLGG
jgi:hypothetical protein